MFTRVPEFIHVKQERGLQKCFFIHPDCVGQHTMNSPRLELSRIRKALSRAKTYFNHLPSIVGLPLVTELSSLVLSRDIWHPHGLAAQRTTDWRGQG
jgi:hypothetical protein